MPEPSAGPLRICVIATPVGDEADQELDALLAAVSGQCALTAARAWESAEDSSPSFAALHQCDVALLCGRRMPLTGEALARVQWYCRRGRPLVALRSGGGPTFDRWPEFDREALGITAAGNVGACPLEIRAHPQSRAHAILAGSGSWGAMAGVPEGIRLADDAEVLLQTCEPGASPLAWTRCRGPARIFATALGQPDNLAAPALARLLAGALRWVSCPEARE